jgi:signal transduction histidine kinase
MIRNIWNEAKGIGKRSFQFRMLSYGTGVVLILLHHVQNDLPLTILEYTSCAVMLLAPHVFLYRYVTSGLSLARVITDTGYDFFFAGLLMGLMNLSIIPSFVFALGALTNYLAVRGFHKLYRILMLPLGCIPILWIEHFQFHFESTNLILLISLTYCVVHYVLNAYILYYSTYTVRLQHTEIEKQQKEIVEKSEELKALNESLKNVNANLEEKVVDRTRELEIKNKKLEEYTFINAHKLRAPVATILGLIQLFDYKNILEGEKIMEGLKKTAVELDNAIKDIREKLEEEGWLSNDTEIEK